MLIELLSVITRLVLSASRERSLITVDQFPSAGCDFSGHSPVDPHLQFLSHMHAYIQSLQPSSLMGLAFTAMYISQARELNQFYTSIHWCSLEQSTKCREALLLMLSLFKKNAGQATFTFINF
jgi:hypothetical protein